MFEVGFTEIVLILGLALLVLGPEKLPGLAQKVGRWTGRARSMARQLRNQLEQEVTLEELAKSRPPTPPPADYAATPASDAHASTGDAGIPSEPYSAHAEAHTAAPPPAEMAPELPIDSNDSGHSDLNIPAPAPASESASDLAKTH